LSFLFNNSLTLFENLAYSFLRSFFPFRLHFLCILNLFTESEGPGKEDPQEVHQRNRSNNRQQQKTHNKSAAAKAALSASANLLGGLTTCKHAENGKPKHCNYRHENNEDNNRNYPASNSFAFARRFPIHHADAAVIWIQSAEVVSVVSSVF